MSNLLAVAVPLASAKPDHVPPASKWETITKRTHVHNGVTYPVEYQVLLFDGLIQTKCIECYFDDRVNEIVRLFSTQPLLDAGAMQIRSINTVHTEFKCDKKDCRDYEHNQGLFYLPEITMHKDKAWDKEGLKDKHGDIYGTYTTLLLMTIRLGVPFTDIGALVERHLLSRIPEPTIVTDTRRIKSLLQPVKVRKDDFKIRARMWTECSLTHGKGFAYRLGSNVFYTHEDNMLYGEGTPEQREYDGLMEDFELVYGDRFIVSEALIKAAVEDTTLEFVDEHSFAYKIKQEYENSRTVEGKQLMQWFGEVESLKKNNFWMWEAESEIMNALKSAFQHINDGYEIYLMMGFYLTIVRVLQKPYLTFRECVEMTKKGPKKEVIYATENTNANKKRKH